MKKLQLASLTLAALLLAGCGASAASTAESTSEAVSTEETAPAATAAPAPAVTKAPAPAAALPDGVYTAKFNTDSSMFHVNEACNGRATLTVKDGKMTVHITLVSKNIENVFLGTAEDAQKIQKKQVCYASHEHEEFVVHVEKTIHLISLLFFWILF